MHCIVFLIAGPENTGDSDSNIGLPIVNLLPKYFYLIALILTIFDV